MRPGARALELFRRVADLPPPRRAAVLDEACADEPGLRGEVEALLAHDAITGQTGDLPAPTTRPRTPRPFASLPATFGRYRLLHEIGAGGMGVVYRAEQLDNRRTVAVKLMTGAGSATSRLAHLDRELRALLLLRHPGIAHLYDAGTAECDGQTVPFLAMEFVDGQPLRRWVAATTPSLRQRIGVLVDVCDAVSAAHRRGVIHRDLKPDNILVETGDGRPRPRVLDFGIARLPDEVGRPALSGTPAYMSPEQLAGEPDLGPPSDVYALGVIAGELLGEATTGDLAQVVAHAREPSRDARYASADAFAADLTAALGRRPVSVRPASALYRLRCFARRDKLRFATAALAAVATPVALGLAWTSVARSRTDLDHALAIARISVEQVTGQLVNLAGTSEVRRKALTELLARVDDLLALRPDDRATLDCQSEILRQLGDIALERNEVEASRSLRARSLTALERALAHGDLSVLDRGRLATAQVLIGDADKQLGQRAEALRRYRLAHAAYEALVAANPANGDCLDDLGWSCDRLAAFAIDDYRFTEAEALLARRDELLAMLRRLQPKSSHNLSGERALHGLRAHLAELRCDFDEQVRELALAVVPARTRYEARPKSTPAQLEYAGSLLTYVQFAGDRLSPAERADQLAPGERLVAELLRVEPEHTLARELLRDYRRLLAGDVPYGSDRNPGGLQFRRELAVKLQAATAAGTR